MNLGEIVSNIKWQNIGGAILLLLTFIQITPVKINPWSYLAKHLGRAINGEVMNEVKSLRSDFDGFKADTEQDKADNCRNRILRFDDELRQHIDHSEEYFNQIIADIDWYKDYCDKHRNYPNSKAEDAMTHIMEIYHECKANNKFI